MTKLYHQSDEHSSILKGDTHTEKFLHLEQESQTQKVAESWRDAQQSRVLDALAEGLG